MDPYLIAAFDFSVIMTNSWTVLKVALGLGLVIFVHELGHFLAAKACGVKCEKFYVGFDIPMKIGPLRLPSTLGKFQWGETEYGIGILPLGGYVKMLGQDDNPMNAEKEAERIRVESPDEEGTTPEGEVELDPRSFPAKPVWQRLIIISAGVVMNMIFAVIFAAVAYKMGLEYTSCEIDGTAPGDPAWVADLRPGDKILQIGKSGAPTEHMRFDWDLREKVVTAGLGSTIQTLDVLIRREGQEKWYQITPRARNSTSNIVSLGVLQPHSTKTHPKISGRGGTPAAEIAELAGKRIVAINDVTLPRDETTQEIFGHHLSRQFALHMDKPLKLTLEKANPAKDEDPRATTTVNIPPRRMRAIGLVMKVGPVTGVQANSAASKAGFQKGDVLSKADGQPIGDPMTLEQRLQKKRGKEVTFVVLRDNQPVTLKAQIGELSGAHDTFGFNAHASITAIGLAFSVEPEVAAVRPGSPAEKAGFKAGDTIEKVTVDMIDGEDKKARVAAVKLLGKNFDKPIPLGGDGSSWPHIHFTMQNLLPGMQLAVTVKRGDQTETKNLIPDETEHYVADRGIIFQAFTRIHTAKSWGEATRLGVRLSVEKLESVVRILQKLVTGQLSVTNLGGPVLIAYVAGSEASRGIARLLVFLTMLSANLAVLNFLPIPALDGGHAVFLCWEGVTGKPASERMQGTLTLIGVGLLLCLMVTVFVMDITRLLP